MVKKTHKNDDLESVGEAKLKKIAELQNNFLERLPTSAGLKFQKKISFNVLSAVTNKNASRAHHETKEEKASSVTPIKQLKSKPIAKETVSGSTTAVKPVTEKKLDLRKERNKLQPVKKKPVEVTGCVKDEGSNPSRNQEAKPNFTAHEPVSPQPEHHEKKENKPSTLFQKAKYYFSLLTKKPK